MNFDLTSPQNNSNSKEHTRLPEARTATPPTTYNMVFTAGLISSQIGQQRNNNDDNINNSSRNNYNNNNNIKLNKKQGTHQKSNSVVCLADSSIALNILGEKIIVTMRSHNSVPLQVSKNSFFSHAFPFALLLVFLLVRCLPQWQLNIMNQYFF